MVTGYLAAKKAKSMRVSLKGEIEKNIGAAWDGRGLLVSSISDLDTKFATYVISYVKKVN